MNRTNIPYVFNNPDWQACLVAFVQQLRSDTTWTSYHGTLTGFFGGDSDKTPDHYTRHEVEAFIHSANRSKWHKGGQPIEPKPRTVNARRSALASFYDYAATFEIPGADGRLVPILQRPSPTRGIRAAKVGRTHRILSEDELSRLFSCIPTDTVIGIRDRVLLYSFLMLARRRRELLTLRFGQIEETLFVENGHIRKGYRYSYLGKGRTEKEWAEMPPDVKAQIDFYIHFSGRAETIKPDDYIFVGHGVRNKPCPNKPLSGSQVLSSLKAYSRACGLDASRVCVHLLRHVSAQQHFLLNPNLLDMQRLLGHSSLATTQIYLQSLCGASDPVAQQLASKFAALGVK